MTEYQLFNGLVFAFIVGMVGWCLTSKNKGRDLSSFDIITIMILAGRKSK